MTEQDDKPKVIEENAGRFEEIFKFLTQSPGKIVNFDERDNKAENTYPLSEKIDDFEKSFYIWNMSYMMLLANGENEKVHYEANTSKHPSVAAYELGSMVNDSGYAVLSLINPYIEVIGRLCGKMPGQYISDGITLVLPEIMSLEEQNRNALTDLFRKAVRNSMAHTFRTGENIILSRDHSEIILLGTYQGRPAISINPQSLFERVFKHFHEYVQQLRIQNPTAEIKELQKQFDERYPSSLRL
ncbi:MAG: hypothetical protein K8L99_36240 [Anaerolineae bacterium]|nr:hypothetical protein [Anaerolineae bacterium]